MTRLLPLLSTVSSDAPPRAGSDRSQTAVAQIVSVASTGRTITVTLLGSAPITIPASAVTWTGATTAYVLLDPDTGRPVHALGPAPAPRASLPSPPSARGPVLVTRTVTIPAMRTSTWSAGGSSPGWGTYDVHGAGPTALWQGSDRGVSLTGMADYGQHIQALGAESIASAVLQAVPLAASSWTLRLQPAEWTETGPQTTSSRTVSAVIGPRPSTVDVTTLAAPLLAGAGLALTGSGLGVLAGGGDAMALTITYTTYA